MNILVALERKLTEFKYQYYGLNIIQEVAAERFHLIISEYVARGWELSGEYYEMDDGASQWSCKLRKGTSTLLCKWDPEANGIFIGPQRIIVGLGQEFDLAVTSTPQQESSTI